MRTCIIRSDEDNKQTAVSMMPYNNDKDKEKVYAYIAEKNLEVLNKESQGAKKYYTHHREEIGFDYIFANGKSGIEAFFKDNPEYCDYESVPIKSKDEKQVGIAVYKNWDCVERAKSLKLVSADLYAQIVAADRKMFDIKLENRGCERNEKLLARIAENIIDEIKNDPVICESLRSGVNRKKENEISYHNWKDGEGKEFSCVTYRNGGQAFSILFDTDMNILTTKYNNKVFVSGNEWIPFEDMEEPKDCLLAIYNKLPEMEFNQWLAEMGENKKYMQLKEELALSHYNPAITISGYSPLSDLGTGYFTLQNQDMQCAVQIKDGEVEGVRYRKVNADNKPVMKWQDECYDKSNPLYSVMLEIHYTGHISKDGASMENASACPEFAAKLSVLDVMVSNMKEQVKKLTKENGKGITNLALDGRMDEILMAVQEMNEGLTVQANISIPIEMETEKEPVSIEDVIKQSQMEATQEQGTQEQRE